MLRNDDPIEVKFTHWLSLLRGVEKRGDYFVALCPAHHDEKQSLSTKIGDKGIVATCHAGCEFPAICHAAGVTSSWMFPPSKPKPVEKIVASWVYCDELGTPLFRVCRYEDGTLSESGKPKKTFRQEQPTKKGVWKAGVKGIRQVPYRLPDLLLSFGAIVIVEGEKQADALYELGFTATCNAGGAGKWREEWKEFFSGRDVVILPDNDQAGRDHARDVTKKLVGAAASVRVGLLPGLPPKGDVIDFLAAGGTREGIESAMATAIRIEELKDPDPPKVDHSVAEDDVAYAEDQKICDALGINVQGEFEDRSVKVFSLPHCKYNVIRDVKKLAFEELLQICGPVARQVVHLSDEDKPDGVFRMKEVRAAIANIAGRNPVDDDEECGVGMWLIEDAIVLVNARRASILRDGELTESSTPSYGPKLLQFPRRHGWFHHDQIAASLRSESHRRVVDRLDEIFGRWMFQSQSVAPRLLTGLTLATWLQSLWHFRPMVSIAGKSGSGKSVLFDFLAAMYDRLAISSAHSSAAGIRQAVGLTSRVLICDEIEGGHHRRDIYEMLRGSSRGSQVLRGTASQKSRGFLLRHVVWVAATESGLFKEPDKNRFISVELLKPPPEEMGKLRIPHGEELESLRADAIAAAAVIAREALALSERFLTTLRPPGVDQRTLELYSVPASCYAVASGRDDAGAVDVLYEMLSTADEERITGGDGDEMRLAAAIMDSIIDIKPGERCTVSQAIQRHFADPGIDEALNRYGLDLIVDPDPPPKEWIAGEKRCLFVNCVAVRRNLLKGTEWEHMDIQQLLKRIHKAVPSIQRRIAKVVKRGPLIPLSAIVSEE